MKKLFTLESARNGRLYTMRDHEVREFYEDHVLGVPKVKIESGKITIVGSLLIQLRDQDQELKDVRAIRNLVTTAGLGAIVDRLNEVGGTIAKFDYIGLGTGTTAAAIGNTTLETEFAGGGYSRIQGTLAQPAATTDRVTSTFPAGNGTGAITEAGRFNASAAGTLLARQVFSVINKAAGDSLQVQHDLTVS